MLNAPQLLGKEGVELWVTESWVWTKEKINQQLEELSLDLSKVSRRSECCWDIWEPCPGPFPSTPYPSGCLVDFSFLGKETEWKSKGPFHPPFCHTHPKPCFSLFVFHCWHFVAYEHFKQTNKKKSGISSHLLWLFVVLFLKSWPL